jgi:hypothetical protein
VLAREGGEQEQAHLGVALDEALAHGLDRVLDLAAQQRAARGGRGRRAARVAARRRRRAGSRQGRGARVHLALDLGEDGVHAALGLALEVVELFRFWIWRGDD